MGMGADGGRTPCDRYQVYGKETAGTEIGREKKKKKTISGKHAYPCSTTSVILRHVKKELILDNPATWEQKL